MEPTRADISARTAEAGTLSRGETGVDFFGRKGVKCFASNKGPRLLTWKVSSALAWSIWDGDFSGCSRPGMQKARRRYPLEKREAQYDAAEAIVDSSKGAYKVAV